MVTTVAILGRRMRGGFVLGRCSFFREDERLGESALHCVYVCGCVTTPYYRVYSHELEQLLAHPSKVIVRWFVWRTNVTYVVCLWLMQLVNCGRFIL